MNAFKRLITLFLLILAIIIGAWFGWDNQANQELHFFGVWSPEFPIGVLLLSTLMIGICIGLLVAQFGLYKVRLQNKLLRKQAKQRELSICSGVN